MSKECDKKQMQLEGFTHSAMVSSVKQCLRLESMIDEDFTGDEARVFMFAWTISALDHSDITEKVFGEKGYKICDCAFGKIWDRIIELGKEEEIKH